MDSSLIKFFHKSDKDKAQKSPRTPRVFLGFVEISGYYYRLCRALKELGIDVEYGCGYHPFEYVQAFQLRSSFPRIFYILTRLRYQISTGEYFQKLMARSPKTMRIITYILDGVIILFCILWLFYALFRYDIFVFGFGSSFFPKNRDLWLLKRFKKTIIANLSHGSEARPPYLDGAQLYSSNFLLETVILKTLQIEESIACFERFADFVVAAPLTSHFFQRRFINYFYIGNPCPYQDESRDLSPPVQQENQRVRILHAPSYPPAKGTPQIRAVIERISQQYPLEYIEVIGKPFHEVFSLLKQCDFVIDQLYSDTPLAGLATEAAFLGKPAIVGGYVWEELKKYVPTALWPPSYICHPSQLEDALREMIENPELRRELGEKAQLFVKNFWKPRRVAEAYLRLFSGEIPEEWWMEPLQNFVHVTGMSEEIGREFLKKLLREKGLKALCLEKKPELAYAIMKWCEQNPRSNPLRAFKMASSPPRDTTPLERYGED